MRKILIILSFFFCITKSNAQIRLSSLIESIFCKEETFLRIGYNRDYALFFQKDERVLKELSKCVIIDTPSINCFRFYYSYNALQIEEALVDFKSIDILVINYKKVKENKIKLIFTTQTINKELYDLNLKNKSKVFINGDEWEVLLARKRGGNGWHTVSKCPH